MSSNERYRVTNAHLHCNGYGSCDGCPVQKEKGKIITEERGNVFTEEELVEMIVSRLTNNPNVIAIKHAWEKKNNDNDYPQMVTRFTIHGKPCTRKSGSRIIVDTQVKE